LEYYRTIGLHGKDIHITRWTLMRIYDALFVLRFYGYVRNAYKLTRAKALAKVMTKEWEALRTRAN